MAVNEFVTLNIYKHTPQAENQTTSNINQTEQDLNLNRENQRPTLGDDDSRHQIDNINSAPEPGRTYTGDLSEIPMPTQSKIPVVPLSNGYRNKQCLFPIAGPVPYGGPIVTPSPQIGTEPVNNAPQIIVIQKKPEPKRNFLCPCLVGAASAMAVCCLFQMCCPTRR